MSETIDRSTWTIPTRLSRIGADGEALRIVFRRGVAHYRASSFFFSSSLARRSLRPWPVFRIVPALRDVKSITLTTLSLLFEE